ncbi:hypothetical protein MNEG_4120 [Monoraphidium neglectum]|uniref:Uncharacterized protein n=1 Tax=Monoraphidium neglectum TaxID=145388 RepID=A0A0D2MTP5_9CHLO|nr:hypothetical protein MNEG_4120 [Monoraphidium neglectum]KIZ03842.1 hypothetical protein MNEG_4120 [Monoraphidium neglectum]|eukprot:XP_013902861.1 hypothetical protein MNEG_4120 [Monoraphidium neglectum]
MRVLTARQLPRAAAEAIRSECERWTQKLRGTRATPLAFWYVNEAQFSTVQGERMRFSLAASSNASGRSCGACSGISSYGPGGVQQNALDEAAARRQ